MKRFSRKEIIQADKDRQNKIAIQQSLELLQVKKQEQKQLQQQLLHVASKEEEMLYSTKLDRCNSAIDKISSRLKNLGVEEKRGRPKKADGERYQEQRKKFTAHLLPETVDYLQQLKSTSAISNISAFLEELIAEHRKKER